MDPYIQASLSVHGQGRHYAYLWAHSVYAISSSGRNFRLTCSLVGWAVGRAHGFGPIFSQGTATTAGNPAAYLFFSAMTSAIAPKATLALNICDFTRYAKSPRTVAWTNVFALSIPVTLCAILGVVVTSAVQVIYGVKTWNPLQVCALWDSRAAQFFAAFCWALAVIATNISAKSVLRFIDIVPF